MSDDPYLYSGSRVLKNKLDIRDEQTLEVVERRLTAERGSQGVPTGGFDLAHLSAIHRHLFQDIYEWAGEVRTVEISKGSSQFQFRAYIETGMADVHRRLVTGKYLCGLGVEAFAREAGQIMGDVNYVHPFREGNGRTQLFYLEQLSRRAGHRIDLRKFDRETWMEASRKAHEADYRAMSDCLRTAIVATRRQDRDRSRDR